MGTSYRLLFAPISVIDIVYFNFTGQMFRQCVIVVFGFLLSPFGLRLGQYLGLTLSLIGHVYFQHFIYFIALCLVKCVETSSQMKPI